MSEFLHGRGEFYYKIEGRCITVYLCNPDVFDGEAEHIVTIDASYLPALLATLRKGATPQ